jgi:hypothetical protein
MKIQKGGLKLKNPSKIGFNAVYDMINSNSGRLKLFTYNSLKGFMITLEVNEADSEYLTLNGTQFTKPVTSFILKFAIITPYDNEKLPPYNGVEKASESQDSYFEEAKLQQRIWKTSISGGREEICPPVANFSLFDNDNAKSLLQFLQGKTIRDINTKNVFDYLFSYINTNIESEIGIIVMPKVERSTTFSDFMKRPNGSDFYGLTLNQEIKTRAEICVAAQVSRLLIDIGVIHFDLHMKNALIFLTSGNKIECILIDFGRASNIMNDYDDEYLDRTEKKNMTRKKDEFFDFLFRNDDDDDIKKRLVFTILKTIADIDKQKNQAMFVYSQPNYYQMQWFDNFPKTDYVLLDTFNKLKKSTEVLQTRITNGTIKAYEREGNFVNFDKEITDFIVPFPKIQSCSDDTKQGNCNVMGGMKTKTKTCKKHKKHKKNKKHKKHKKTRRIDKTKNIH